MKNTTRSLTTIRLAAAAPRLLALLVVGLLAAAGLRVVISGPPPAPAATIVRQTGPMADLAAQAFAQSFAREYLTWTAKGGAQERQGRLRPYLGDTREAGAGLRPAEGTEQSVAWTTAAGTRRRGRGTTVLVAAQTSEGQLHLAVPVSRDRRGFLGVAGFPALTGPPPVDLTGGAGERPEPPVEDADLTRVAQRTVTNFLAGAQENLLADLTPDAVVSLPERRLRVTDVQQVTWVRPQSTIAIEVEAQDGRADTWTLRYELEVRRKDRWYVRRLVLDPTTQGNGS